MIVVCLFVMAAFLLYAICRAPSRVYRPLEHRTLVFRSPSAAEPFEDLLAVGDAESVSRILKALAGRGDIQIQETEKEILINCPGPPPKRRLRIVKDDCQSRVPDAVDRQALLQPHLDPGS